MAGRYKEILEPEMPVEHPVYRFDYLDQVFRLGGREQVESIHRTGPKRTQCIFYVVEEELAVGDHMVVSRFIGYQQIPCAVLAAGRDRLLGPNASLRPRRPR